MSRKLKWIKEQKDHASEHSKEMCPLPVCSTAKTVWNLINHLDFNFIFQNILLDVPVWLNTLTACGLQCFLSGKCLPVHCAHPAVRSWGANGIKGVCAYPLCDRFAGDDTMTGDGGEYLRPEDLRELGDDSLPSSQFLDGMNYLRYSLEGGRSDRYLLGYITFLILILHSFCCECVKSLVGCLCLGCTGQHLFTRCVSMAVTTLQEEGVWSSSSAAATSQGMGGQGFEHRVSWLFGVVYGQDIRRGAMDPVILHWTGSECTVSKDIHSF